MKAKRGVSASPEKIEFYKKRLIDDGVSLSEIAREKGVSREAVSVFAKKHFKRKISWELRV
jgi:predicted DNA-binding protein YlxM (UPF0122 family)